PRQEAFELKEIAPLRRGQGGASMNAELCDIESDLAQLAYHENLEVFRRELRQFGHRSTLLERRTQTLRQRAPGRQVRRKRRRSGGCALPTPSLYHPTVGEEPRAPTSSRARRSVCWSVDGISYASPPAPERAPPSAGSSAWACRWPRPWHRSRGSGLRTPRRRRASARSVRSGAGALLPRAAARRPIS